MRITAQLEQCFFLFNEVTSMFYCAKVMSSVWLMGALHNAPTETAKKRAA
jgi:hypothetical protein